VVRPTRRKKVQRNGATNALPKAAPNVALANASRPPILGVVLLAPEGFAERKPPARDFGDLR